MENTDNRKTYKKLTGSASGGNAALIVGGIFIAFGYLIMALLLIMKLKSTEIGFGKSTFEDVFVGLLVLFYVGLLIIYINLIVSRVKHSKQLKEKFSKLSPGEVEHVSALITNYKGDLIKYDDKYLYGNMSKLRQRGIFRRGVITFEYLPLNNLAWLYYIDSKITPKMEASIVGAGMGLVMGSIITDIPKSYHDIEHMLGVIKYEPRAVNTVCIFLRDGSCYKAKISMKDYDRLKNAIVTVNPSCKFGFSQEIYDDFTK